MASSKPDDLRHMVGLAEGIAKAKAKGELLQFLEALDREAEEEKWRETGRNHSLWKRDWSIYRSKHVRDKDPRFPRPIENHVWSLIESIRPLFNDNIPDVQFLPLDPVVQGLSSKMNLMWKWIAWKACYEDFWASLYDFYAPLGTASAKAWWNWSSMKGGSPVLTAMDPRAIAADGLARINHRSASVIRTKHLVDIGELKSKYPQFESKINAMNDDRDGRFGQDRELHRARDLQRSSTVSSGRVEDRVTEVVEMWIRPQPVIPALSETDTNSEKESNKLLEDFVEDDRNEEIEEISMDEPWMVYTFIPKVGVIGEEVAENGLQLATAQCWRNADSMYGISDVSMIAGLQIASDQLAIRGHAHRLAVFAPPLLLPKDSGISKRQVSGRAAPIWQPSTSELAKGIGFLNVPGPSPEALNYLAERPGMMRQLLGIDELSSSVLEREQTATAVSEVRAAIESRIRQKIRNMNPLIQDMAKAIMKITLTNSQLSVFVPEENGGFTEVTREEMDALRQNINRFAVKTTAMNSGPLTKVGQVNAISAGIQAGVFTRSDGVISLPIQLRQDMVDLLDIPRSEEIKREIQEQEEAIEQAAKELAEQEDAQLQQQGAAEADQASEAALAEFDQAQIPQGDASDISEEDLEAMTPEELGRVRI